MCANNPDLHKSIEENERRLEEEREELDRLAEASLRAGISLGNNPKVLKQSKIVDELVLENHFLKKKQEEGEVAEGNRTAKKHVDAAQEQEELDRLAKQSLRGKK